MAQKELFDKPFDEGTITKLEIFEKYFEKWLPTFLISDKIKKPIQVFDLFAGKGYDNNKTPGSPIRIINIINKHRENIQKYRKQIILFFNDADKDKVSALKSNVEEEVNKLSLDPLISIKFNSITFKQCLTEYKNELLNGCNLIFIDQNGFKEVTKSIFHILANLDMTDFIFFISSTHIRRFAKSSEIQNIHPDFDFEGIINTPISQIHNKICEEYKKYIPGNLVDCYLIPFSIMKEERKNIYGTIFVSKHILAADKYLSTVWEKNVLNGEANFDINDDTQLQLVNKLTKIEAFQKDLRRSILDGKIKTNIDAYLFTIKKGHLPSHAYEEIKRMKDEKLINYERKSPLVNYNSFKNNVIVDYNLIKNE